MCRQVRSCAPRSAISPAFIEEVPAPDRSCGSFPAWTSACMTGIWTVGVRPRLAIWRPFGVYQRATVMRTAPMLFTRGSQTCTDPLPYVGIPTSWRAGNPESRRPRFPPRKPFRCPPERPSGSCRRQPSGVGIRSDFVAVAVPFRPPAVYRPAGTAMPRRPPTSPGRRDCRAGPGSTPWDFWLIRSLSAV